MKFLVLHGYGQNGSIFQRKHRGVERHIRQTFPDASFVYPTAPVKLRSDDRPEDSIDASTLFTSEAENLVQRCIEPRGWCHLYSACDTPFGLTESLDQIAETLTSQGPFDGIIAFSQGTYVASMVISLLEGESRYMAYVEAKMSDPAAFEYPQSFRNIAHPPLKFGVLYSGFMAQQSQFDWLYDMPRIQTPILHYVGEVDPVLEDQWREAMHERVCDDNGPNVVVHPGSHHVPTSVKHLKPLTAFIQTSIDNYVYVAPVEEEKVSEDECDERNDSGVETEDYSRLFSTLRSRRRSTAPRRQRAPLHFEREFCRRNNSYVSSARCFESPLAPLTPIWPRRKTLEKSASEIDLHSLKISAEFTCPPALLTQMGYLSSSGIHFAEVVY